MKEVADVWRHRLARLESVCPTASVTGPGRASSRELVALTSSRLGNDAHRHRRICDYLRRSMIDCKRRGSELLVACGSAIEPWADRAAELFDVTCRKLELSAVTESSFLAVTCHDQDAINVDAALIALADRVDAVYVRRGGRIAACLQQQLSVRNDCTVRVGITMDRGDAVRELIQQGAIGWLLVGDAPSELVKSNCLPGNPRLWLGDQTDDEWGRTDGQWLIHCTRARIGPWPGETERQYRDSMLLGEATSAQRGPLDALMRIIRSRRIVASARSSRQDQPVVCFSALPLQQFLALRCFRSHLGRWDYEPFGVAIRISAARQRGVQPVVYGSPKERDSLPADEQFRFHPRGTKVDWSQEREWRSPQSIDLGSLDPRNVRVFALGTKASRAALSQCVWQVSFLGGTGPDDGSGWQNQEKDYNSN
jgi:hypothetical protein